MDRAYRAVRAHGGQAAFAEGRVPQAGAKSYFTTLVQGGEAPGEWQNDLPMIDHPICISLEFPVTQVQASGLVPYWRDLARGQFKTYSFEVLGDGRCNCVWASSSVLRAYAESNGIAEVAAVMRKVTSPVQGKLMGQIMGRELLAA
jgi:hypothetical protein